MTLARFLAIAVCALVLAGATTVPENRLKDPELEAKAQEIMSELRCLVCQSESIANSNAKLAGDLRRVVRERVAAGDSAGEVKAYMQERYGDWVLMQPPFKMKTLLLWLAPVLFLAIGAVILFIGARRRLERFDDTEGDEPAA